MSSLQELAMNKLVQQLANAPLSIQEKVVGITKDEMYKQVKEKVWNDLSKSLPHTMTHMVETILEIRRCHSVSYRSTGTLQDLVVWATAEAVVDILPDEAIFPRDDDYEITHEESR